MLDLGLPKRDGLEVLRRLRGQGLTSVPQPIEVKLFSDDLAARRREVFYWLAILLTFALGTAAGDLAAERLALGYLPATLVFGTLIAGVALGHFRFALDPILSFWIAYVLTRPLGASLGDYLSKQPAEAASALARRQRACCS